MRKRVLTGAGLLSALLLLLLADAREPTGLFFASVTALITVVGAIECAGFSARRGLDPSPFLAGSAAFLLIALTWLLFQENLPESARIFVFDEDVPGDVQILLLEALAFLFLMGTFLAYARRESLSPALPGLAATWFAFVYVGVGMSFLVRLRLMDESGYQRVWILLAVTKFGDMAAYFGGKRFGRRPMAPRISPKKTLEGAAFGLLASTLTGMLWAPIFEGRLRWTEGLLLGLLVGFVSQMSDLAESLLKRSADVKDSSPLFGEAGGVLDQVDSILFAAPLTFYYFRLLPP